MTINNNNETNTSIVNSNNDDIECGVVNVHHDNDILLLPSSSEEDERSTKTFILSTNTRCVLRRLSLVLISLSVCYVLIDQIDSHSSRRIGIDNISSSSSSSSSILDGLTWEIFHHESSGRSRNDIIFDQEDSKKVDDYKFEYMTDDQLRNDNSHALQRFVEWNKKQQNKNNAQLNQMTSPTSAATSSEEEFQYIEASNESNDSDNDMSESKIHPAVDAVDKIRHAQEYPSDDDDDDDAGASFTFPYATDDELRNVNLNILGRFETWKAHYDRQHHHHYEKQQQHYQKYSFKQNPTYAAAN